MAQNLGNFIDIKCIKEHEWETRWSLREAEQLDKLKHTISLPPTSVCPVCLIPRGIEYEQAKSSFMYSHLELEFDNLLAFVDRLTVGCSFTSQ